jgi:hypothetical protein
MIVKVQEGLVGIFICNYRRRVPMCALAIRSSESRSRLTNSLVCHPPSEVSLRALLQGMIIRKSYRARRLCKGCSWKLLCCRNFCSRQDEFRTEVNSRHLLICISYPLLTYTHITSTEPPTIFSKQQKPIKPHKKISKMKSREALIALNPILGS